MLDKVYLALNSFHLSLGIYAIKYFFFMPSFFLNDYYYTTITLNTKYYYTTIVNNCVQIISYELIGFRGIIGAY